MKNSKRFIQQSSSDVALIALFTLVHFSSREVIEKLGVFKGVVSGHVRDVATLHIFNAGESDALLNKYPFKRVSDCDRVFASNRATREVRKVRDKAVYRFRTLEE